MSGLKSGADLIASAPRLIQERFLETLTEAELAALPHLFAFWAMPHQIPPAGDWRTWIVMGGRGAGKTRAGAEWVRALTAGPTPEARHIALVGETIEQAREVMVFGESGILAVTPLEERPEWVASRKMLIWPNGAQAQIFSAFDPESLRGPQFDAAWADELAKWPEAEATWDMLQFALRLGADPRVMVTTTPRNVPVMRQLLAAPDTVTTRAPTAANAANLAKGFMEAVTQRYGGTRLGRQELDGVMLTDVEGSLWDMTQVDRTMLRHPPQFDRIVVAVDPPASAGAKADTCGIIVAGAEMSGPPQDWRAVVVEDASVQGLQPNGWAEAAVAAFHRHAADALVAEVNQGGAMVETIIRMIDPLIPIKTVHASRGKVVRAEPVAALYAQGRVRHLPGLGPLEDEMGLMAVHGYQGAGSPDRVDALVWALTELMILPAKQTLQPQFRSI